MNTDAKSDLTSPEAVRSYPFLSGRIMPVAFEPAQSGVVLADWAASNHDFIESSLAKHGAILFRGFPLHTVADFEAASASIMQELYGGYGDLPRADASEKIYASTPYPANKPILFHNESSHLSSWPSRIAFFCMQAAQKGGETPLLDCRELCDRMRPELLEMFDSKGLMYVRNFTEGLDVSWQDFFHTKDKAVVEQNCGKENLECDWRPNDGLRIRYRTRAVWRHPVSHDRVFFNQVQLHHTACLEPDVRTALLSIFGEGGLPRSVYFGDGSPIDDSIINELGDLYQEMSVAFPWHEGDIILLDNMLVAHARNPFEGPRRICVAMGQMIAGQALLNN